MRAPTSSHRSSRRVLRRPLVLLPVALATGLAVRRGRRRRATATDGRPRAGAPQSAPRSRRTLPRGLGAAVLVAALLGPVAAASSQGTCAPDPDGLRMLHAELGDDGDVRSAETRIVTLRGTTCTLPEVPSVDELGVQVAILHRDAAGTSLETPRLSTHDGAVTTRVRVTDATLRSDDDAAGGPSEHAGGEERGVPQAVRITVRYPDGWQLAALPPLGASVHLPARGGPEVTIDALLFVPFTTDTLLLETTALPARGTPTVIVETTPASPDTLRALLDRTVDRRTLAVVGALLDLTADGTEDLADGALQLADGLDELADGVGELYDGVDELYDGVGELVDGVAELSKGVDALADGTRAYTDGVGDVADGAAALAAGLDQVGAGLTGATQLAQLLAASGAAAAGGADPAIDDDEVLNVSPLLPMPLPVFPTGPAEDDLGTFTQSLGFLAASLVQLDGGLSDEDESIRTGLRALADGLELLADGGDDLADGTDELARGVRELLTGVRELRDGVGELREGVGELRDATREIADGARELADGAAELPGAVREILGIVDRRADELNADAARVEDGITAGAARAGGSGVVVTRLEHVGASAMSPAVPAAASGALATAGGIGWLFRRRRRA
jgi:X-X-X-Leu-X-X-Gly heptad repeat protein